MRLKYLAIPLALSTVVFAACGNDDKASPTTASNASTSAPASTTPEASSSAFNDADVTFAQGMIVHHEQAIEMAELALDPNAVAGAQTKDLAARIQAAQDPEIATLTSLLNQWGQPVEMATHDGHDMSSMDGMMSPADMDALGAATGSDFDRKWMEMMIEHHTGAITMAKTVKSQGASHELKSMADQIITAQQAEIDEMQGALGS